MEGNTQRTRMFGGASPTCAEARREMNQSIKETLYWGVLCRTCQGLIAFDVAPYVSFGPNASSMKPGAICCGYGHIHTYFPHDFRFSGSRVSISEVVMRDHRDTYRAVASSGQRSSGDSVQEALEQPANPASDVSVLVPAGEKVRPARLGPDPRREAAKMAANKRWANWAGLKKVP